MSEANEQFDDRYVRFREHADVRERVTALEGNQTQVMNVLSRIETTLNARPVVPPPAPVQQETAAALALHRALDAFDRNKTSGTSPFIMTLAIIGAIALGAGAVWLFTH